jgi:uncharacterized protein
MNLMFFGSSARQLFGAYHAPPPSVAGRGAAVLCSPWGMESLACYRVLRRLAQRLSSSGYHVLRFDYYGTGDSAGERTDGDLTSWCADASIAVDELRDLSGCSTVASLGVRLGAVVAWRLALARQDVRTVVMWDPVVNGGDYVKELIAAQVESDRWSLLQTTIQSSEDADLDLLEFPLTPAMRRTIQAVGLTEFGQPVKADVTVFHSVIPLDQCKLGEVFKKAGTRFRAEAAIGQTPWRAKESVGLEDLPVLKSIVEVLR